MRLMNRLVALLLLPLFVVSSPAFAQHARVVDASAIDAALAGKAAIEQVQRDAVLRVLERDDVREMAVRLGLDVGDATSAVATLDGAELGSLAQHAGALEAAALAGGQGTIAISVTTLLLIIIIIILLAK